VIKWIGQHIVSLVARFRSDIYLENLTATNETSVLVVDNVGKISKRLTIGGGDMTGVDLTGGNAISVTSEANTASGAYSATISHDDTSSQASVNNSGSTYIQDLEVDTYGHVTGLTSAAIPTLNQNTTGSAGTVTAGTQGAITTCANLATVGTIGTGEWRATAISSTYIADDAVTEDKLADTLLAEIVANSGKVTAHTLIDSDAMTGASATNVASAESIKAYVDGKYATSYLAFLCDTDAFVANQYITVSGNGISNHAWNVDTDLDYTDTNARTIGHADAHISMSANMLTASIIIPQACQLMGFYAIARNEVSGNLGAAPFGFGIFHTAEANVNFGNASTNCTGDNTILRAYGISPNTNNEKKHQKIDAMLATPFALAEGDVLTPAAWGATNDQVKGTITLVLRTLVQ